MQRFTVGVPAPDQAPTFPDVQEKLPREFMKGVEVISDHTYLPINSLSISQTRC